MRLLQCRRSGRHWFVSDGLIWDDQLAAFGGKHGRPLECSSRLFVFSPQAADAEVKATFHDVDRPPTAVEFMVPAGEIECSFVGVPMKLAAGRRGPRSREG